MVTEEVAFSSCSAFECVRRNTEADERCNGSGMGEGLPRPRRGPAAWEPGAESHLCCLL